MAKKKVTEEEVENGTKKAKTEKIVPRMKKITPKRVKVPQKEEVVEVAPEEPVVMEEEKVEEAPMPKQKVAKKPVI